MNTSNINKSLNSSMNSAKNSMNTVVSNVKSGDPTTIVIVVIIGIFVLYLLRRLYTDYSFYNSGRQLIIDGTADETRLVTTAGKDIKPSIDGRYGMEYTYSFWLFVENWTTTERMPIFVKGDTNGLLHAPSCTMEKSENKLHIMQDSLADGNSRSSEGCTIDNIPVQKWVHIVISLIGKNIDIYVNGRLSKRCELSGVGRLNMNNLTINAHHLINGEHSANGKYKLSNFIYRNYAIRTWELEREFTKGPNMKEYNSTDAPIDTTYLANDYWTKNQ